MNALTSVDTTLTEQSIGDMLVEAVASRLARFVRPFQLRREIEEFISELRGKPIKLSQESVDELIGKAQQFLTSRSGESPQLIASKQIGFLQDVILDEGLDIRVQLVANSQLTELVGTSAKHRSEMYDPDSTTELIRKMVDEMDNDMIE